MRNPLIPRLKSSTPTLGMWVTLESPAISEIAAALGLDWIVVEMEHGHLGYREVMEHLRAARGSELAVLVRVPDSRIDTLKRSLDMGAHGVLLPLVRSAADVEQGFRYGRYPPRGVRGVGGERSVGWGLRWQEYLTTGDAETLIIPIIETRDAIDELEAILATPGLEAIFFGPADLSASQGYLAEWEGPGVADQILSARRMAEERGIASGVMGRSLEDMQRRRDQGFRMIGLGADAGLVISALQSLLATLRPSG